MTLKRLGNTAFTNVIVYHWLSQIESWVVFFLFDFAILLSNLEMPLSLFVVSFFIVHVCFTLLSLCCTLSLSV